MAICAGGVELLRHVGQGRRLEPRKAAAERKERDVRNSILGVGNRLWSASSLVFVRSLHPDERLQVDHVAPVLARALVLANVIREREQA